MNPKSGFCGLRIGPVWREAPQLPGTGGEHDSQWRCKAPSHNIASVKARYCETVSVADGVLGPISAGISRVTPDYEPNSTFPGSNNSNRRTAPSQAMTDDDADLDVKDETIASSSVNAFRASLLHFSHTSPTKPSSLKRSCSSVESPPNRRKITRTKSEAGPSTPKGKKSLPYAPPETYAHLDPLQDNLKPHLDSKFAIQFLSSLWLLNPTLIVLFCGIK